MGVVCCLSENVLGLNGDEVAAGHLFCFLQLLFPLGLEQFLNALGI